MSSRNCKHSANSFCYVCGEYMNVRAKKINLASNKKVCEAYQACFKLPIQNLDKKWAPNFCCYQCKATLSNWFNGNSNHLRFSVPRIWREPTNHVNDCYFCIVEPKRGRAAKNTIYPDLPSSSAPVPYKIDEPITRPSNQHENTPPISSPVISVSSYQSAKCAHNIFNELDLIDLVRDLKLCKNAAEILGSRLQQRNLLGPNVKITAQRKRHEIFSSFFIKEDGLCYCNDIKGLFEQIEFKAGENNVKSQVLVKPEHILMPPLHIKLGLMKQFVKALSKESEAFIFLKEFFPKLSEAKVKAGIFVGPEIKKIMASEEFPKLLSNIEKQAWDSLKAVVHNFLGNNKAVNYKQVVSTLLHNFKLMGCRMSLKLHMLHAHLDKFENNMGDYSEEQGERFHQDIREFEHRYQGQYDENMMGDYIWTLIRESPMKNKRNALRNHF